MRLANIVALACTTLRNAFNEYTAGKTVSACHKPARGFVMRQTPSRSAAPETIACGASASSMIRTFSAAWPLPPPLLDTWRRAIPCHHAASGGKARPHTHRTLDDLQPRIRITELLNDVHRMTGFADTFTELRGRPHNNPNAVLAAVLADACNLGIEKMADASQGISYAQLAWTHSWHMSDENYRGALATIINAHPALPLAAAWGAGTTSSSDGQYFRAGPFRRLSQCTAGQQTAAVGHRKPRRRGDLRSCMARCLFRFKAFQIGNCL
jgi:hypothetical protein